MKEDMTLSVEEPMLWKLSFEISKKLEAVGALLNAYALLCEAMGMASETKLLMKYSTNLKTIELYTRKVVASMCVNLEILKDIDTKETTPPPL